MIYGIDDIFKILKMIPRAGSKTFSPTDFQVNADYFNLFYVFLIKKLAEEGFLEIPANGYIEENGKTVLVQGVKIDLAGLDFIEDPRADHPIFS